MRFIGHFISMTELSATKTELETFVQIIDAERNYEPVVIVSKVIIRKPLTYDDKAQKLFFNKMELIMLMILLFVRSIV